MAPCCTAQSDGGGIYPASEGPPEGKCEVQRAFPDKAPVRRGPLGGSAKCNEPSPDSAPGGHSPLRGDRGQGVDKPPLSPGRRGGHNAVMSSEDSANPHVV